MYSVKLRKILLVIGVVTTYSLTLKKKGHTGYQSCRFVLCSSEKSDTSYQSCNHVFCDTEKSYAGYRRCYFMLCNI